MKIKAISLILAALFCITLLASCGAGENPDSDKEISIGSLVGMSEGLEYQVNENNPSTCTITGIGTCTDTVIKIPSSIDGKMVTGVAAGAFAVSNESKPMPKRASRSFAPRDASSSTDFSDLSGSFQPIIGTNPDVSSGVTEKTEAEEAVLSELQGVVFPYTVREIGEEAFLGCENLESITTSQNIQSIGKDAFKDTAYYNNEGNWENHALYLSNYLITVDTSYAGEFTIKDGTTIIADQAFYQCVNITGVNMAETVIYTGNFTFYGCTNLTYVNGGGESIFGSGAFDGCVSYKDFIFDFGGATGGNQQPNEEVSNCYEEIDPHTFHSRKDMPTEYVCTTRYNETERVITYRVNEYGFYYTNEIEGEMVTELYGIIDENGTTVYIRKDEMWYLSTATLPENEYYIPRDLTFDKLTMYDEEKFLYAYVYDEGYRIEIGFKTGRLEYIGYIMEEVEIKTVYSDYGFIVLPDFSNADVVEGVVLDINKNPVE